MTDHYALLVDSDLHYASRMETVLMGAGIQIIAAVSHAHALELARINCPEIIMLDLDRPARESVRLLGDLGALGVEAPILWISENITQENIERVRNSGHSGLLPRDADTVTAVCALRAVLSGDRYFPQRYSRPSSPEQKADAESKRIIKLLTPYEYDDLSESES